MANPETEQKIILITRKTRLDELIVRYNTMEQARFVVESQGIDFEDYLVEQERYELSRKLAEQVLGQIGRTQVVERTYLPNFIFGKDDLVVVLGQDGLVANTLKYLDGQWVLGINPDPDRWDGILLPFEVKDLGLVVADTLNRRRQIKEVTMAKATLNDGQTLYAVNDLFIGPKTHFSARYEIAIGGKTERHSSSGVIVSTGLGSTGWLASLLKGATGITASLTDRSLQLNQAPRVEWDANYLYYTVREPFPSNVTQTDLVFGKITDRKRLKLTSQMPENGVIFSDGIENDFLHFNAGIGAEIGIAEKRGLLVT